MHPNIHDTARAREKKKSEVKNKEGLFRCVPCKTQSGEVTMGSSLLSNFINVDIFCEMFDPLTICMSNTLMLVPFKTPLCHQFLLSR